MPAKDTRSLEQKLIDYTDRSGGPNACWPWTRSRNADGYGRFCLPGLHKAIGSHRVTFFVHHGYWPENACHTCDNPWCCNPSHIFDGTHADNARDAQKKGRLIQPDTRGSRHGNSKLTEDDVMSMRTLRSLGFLLTDIGDLFGVSFQAVSDACNGKSWGHLPYPEEL